MAKTYLNEPRSQCVVKQYIEPVELEAVPSRRGPSRLREQSQCDYGTDALPHQPLRGAPSAD